MKLDLPDSGKYVLAVSGGIDSVTLLHLLAKEPGYDLVIAHFDHGIRSDSLVDLEFVAELAQNYGLDFESESVELGAGASEAVARSERYKFLRRVKNDRQASAILTAHHQDDVIETAIINLVRGTGRRGLTALSSHDDLIRPLLNISKADINTYATTNGLNWREDSTNQDDSYLRNYIRQKVMPRIDKSSRETLVGLIKELAATNQSLDELIDGLLESHSDSGLVDRQWFNSLDYQSSKEVLASWLRNNGLSFNTKSLSLLVVFAKVGQFGHVIPIQKGYNMSVERRHLALTVAER